MKKQDKDIIDQINKTLAPLDEQNQLPQQLSKENIEKALEKVEVIKVQASPDNSKKKKNRTIAFVAAAFVLVVGIAMFSNVLSNKLPTTKTQGKASTALEKVDNYDDIEAMFIKMQKEAKEEQRGNFFDRFINGFSEKSTLDSSGIENTVGNAVQQDEKTSSQNENDYSQTNNQVSGVDEADIIKNDGEYLYVVAQGGNVLSIVNAVPATDMKVVSTIKASENCPINDIYVYKNTLVATCSSNNYICGDYAKSGVAYDCVYPRESKTTAIIYDTSDKSNPKQIKSFTQDGNCVTTRLIGDKLYIVSNYGVYIYNDEKKVKESCVPTTSINEEKHQRIPVSDICIMPNNDISEYLVVCGIDLSNLDSEPSKKAILGGSADAYCTTNSLYAARTVYSYSKSWSSDTCKTEIYRFSLEKGEVEFLQKGEVDGYFLNQFSMDEYNGYFRVATTQPDNSQGSNVFVLNDKLQVVGEIRNIAKNESIFAVRFIKEKGYVVTFEQTDPLFIINFAEPTNPKITGELKIPGFSNYLHPYSDTILIGIGKNGDQNGALDGLKISLFDISDKSSPKEIDSYVIKNADSEAQYNHKAFLTSGKNGFFGIPVSIYDSNGRYKFAFDMFTVQDGKLKLVGDYTNYNSNESKSEYESFMEVRRGAYIGDTLYVISDSKIKAFSIKTNQQLGSVNIDVINAQ